MKIGFILTRSPTESETDSILEKVALQYLKKGDEVSLFLLGDSVWLVRKSENQMESILKKGGRLLVSKDHLTACGLSVNELLLGVEIIEDAYDALVELVMEKLDKVVII